MESSFLIRGWYHKRERTTSYPLYLMPQALVGHVACIWSSPGLVRGAVLCFTTGRHCKLRYILAMRHQVHGMDASSVASNTGLLNIFSLLVLLHPAVLILKRLHKTTWSHSSHATKMSSYTAAELGYSTPHQARSLRACMVCSIVQLHSVCCSFRFTCLASIFANSGS